MLGKLPMIGAIGAVLLMATATNPAYSAQSGCELYARQAVSQYHEMMRTPGCRVAVSRGWNPDYQTHWQWCKSVEPKRGGAWNHIWRETDLRERWLCRCTRRCM